MFFKFYSDPTSTLAQVLSEGIGHNHVVVGSASVETACRAGGVEGQGKEGRGRLASTAAAGGVLCKVCAVSRRCCVAAARHKAHSFPALPQVTWIGQMKVTGGCFHGEVGHAFHGEALELAAAGEYIIESQDLAHHLHLQVQVPTFHWGWERGC